MAAMQAHWDIFCRVIDNFGDIGVCWRLARQLAAEHGRRVRLWVDHPASLAPLQPGVDAALPRQSVAGVEIRHWPANFPTVDAAEVADVVIEAFACELPPAYLAAMAARRPAPGWINLEYLSAEPWVESCHGVASPHPTLPLVKHFFFPGFAGRTGGLLRESGLIARRDGFLAGLPPSSPLEISLFCYDTAPVGELIETWSAADYPIRCHVPPGKPLAAVRAHLDGPGPWRRGGLEVLPIPFLPLDGYDQLLWRCDVNFVRGEDSFVRAQWAGKPLVWHIYPQEDAAHEAKLEAFLDRYTATAESALAGAVRQLFLSWNRGSGVGAAWREFASCREALEAHARTWAGSLASGPDLASSLVKFCTAGL